MRKLASVRVIDAISAIPEADAIEVATIGGWDVVVKKGEYKPGDVAVYFEVDSWIPTTLAGFLTKPGQEPREYEGIKGERLKTVKLRGQLSQGLLLPLSVLPSIPDSTADWEDEDDVTELLGILKWEPPVNAQTGGAPRGNFPSLVPKTDEDRIQNMSRQFPKWIEDKLTFEVSEKLEGTSCTMYLHHDSFEQFAVCSRNLSLTENPDNTLWALAREFRVEEQLRERELFGLAIQGEVIGPGIQKNIYKLNRPEFHVYKIYDTKAGAYMDTNERRELCEALGLKHVPVLSKSMDLEHLTIKDVLALAEGKSQLLATQEREGLVFKCNEIPELSFKAISNKYLLKNQ